jgi:complement component 1 Q subcomponent-binding protein
MISIRTFGRAAPRTVSRLSASALKSKSTRPISVLKSAFNPSPIHYASAFSTSTFRRSNATESDEDLIAKLESEIQMENEMKDESGVPTSVKDYLENSPFQIIDTPGQEDVILTRTFGDER